MKFVQLAHIVLFITTFIGAIYEGVSKISDSAASEGINVNAEKEPDFSAPIKNITVPLGREGVLTCSVTELGHYKVGWMKAEDQTILSLHTRVVTHNSRVSVTHDNLKTWQLHIRQIKETDKGCYMCQINTNIMKKQLGCIDVHIPPDISDQMTASDVTVREGDNATLTCKAVGHPQPRIVWKREDGEKITLKNQLRDNTSVETYNGDALHLVKLDRHQMGSYLCIASNDVPPAVSKRISLHINFSPVIKVQKEMVGAPLGSNITLNCTIEAFPFTVHYWNKTRENRIYQGKKYSLEEQRKSYILLLRLNIRQISRDDYGFYTCTASNSLGKAEGRVRLYEVEIPTTTMRTTTTTTRTTTTMKTTRKTTTEEPITFNRIPPTAMTPAKTFQGGRAQPHHENPKSLTDGLRREGTASRFPGLPLINNFSIHSSPSRVFLVFVLFALNVFR